MIFTQLLLSVTKAAGSIFSHYISTAKNLVDSKKTLYFLIYLKDIYKNLKDRNWFWFLATRLLMLMRTNLESLTCLSLTLWVS